jgi:heterodisulfide reductase subunit A-like polyferredoxin
MRKPVLVVGGGIAGIQASLDLAEMDVPVFIIENSPSLGGRMAQLDKTFPTNDCSACILAPKVTSCYNHPLIKTFTLSELVDLRGEAPEFTAVIKKKARFIDEDLCRGCNACISKCPIEKKSEFDMGIGNRRAVYKPYAQAVPNKVVIDKKGTSPCKFNCPAHMDAHGYVALTGQGRYLEALEVVRRTTPFASVLGRVCSHPCEAGCARQYVDSPVSLAALKRFIADYEVQQGIVPKIKTAAQKKDAMVAVIGSGPAGLNCAYRLAVEGYKVTVFEALPEPGGMLRAGIPAFRLDKKVLEREIDIVKSLGVEIICNSPVGRNLTLDMLRDKGYKAFFVATGAHAGKKAGIPGEETPGVIDALDFLRELNLSGTAPAGKKTVVIGRTREALDAARSAVRMGSKVTLVVTGAAGDMDIRKNEIEYAKEEGVRFEFNCVPVEVISDGEKATGLKCARMSGHGSANTADSAVDISTAFIIEADTIITAVGRSIESSPLVEAGINCFDKDGKIAVNPESLETGIPGVFAGGDAVSGDSGVINAIARGNMAAMSIINYLEGKDLPVRPQVLPVTPIEEIDFSCAENTPRVGMPVLEPDKRTGTFEETEKGLTEDQAKNEALRCIDCSVCCECRICEKMCGFKAIRHDQRDELIELEVSSVIFANGYDTVTEIPDGYGYGKYKDVVTSLEYERILSASGPYQGHIRRPSDNKVPERIAFIQCTGSRDEKCASGYCSSVCCMYAVKEAVITREHLPSVKDIDIFYMDMRAYGKDFDKYVDTARNKYSVGFIRSRVSGVEINEATGRLVVSFCDESGNPASGEYDMVVLSVGMKPGGEKRELFDKIGVKTDKYGFLWTSELDAPKTSRDGILACGAMAGPKDIPETVVEASAAASEAFKASGGAGTGREEYDDYFEKEEEAVFRDVSREPVRVGVFLCHCGKNIGDYLDVKEAVKYARTLPGVEYATDFMYACSVDSQKAIADRITKFNLNRVVVASCTPRTHEPLFQGVLASAGLNPYLLTMANIREQCSWVHMNNREEATEKAKELVRMAVARIIHAKQLSKQSIDVTGSVLVIGGGVAGMAAALEIAGMGYKAFLVEKTGRLGGNALKLNATLAGRPAAMRVGRMIDEVMSNDMIEVYLKTSVKSVDGYIGNYTTALDREGYEFEINHGAVIIASGARESRPVEYQYGRHDMVLTQLELEDALRNNKIDLYGKKEIFMIQCVGSRGRGKALLQQGMLQPGDKKRDNSEGSMPRGKCDDSLQGYKIIRAERGKLPEGKKTGRPVCQV